MKRVRKGMKHAWLIPAVLLILIVIGYATPISSVFFKSGIFTYWTKGDSSLVVNIDTTGLKNWWPLDSLGSLIGGSDQRDIEYMMYAAKNFAEGTKDTVWFYHPNTLYALPQTLPNIADRFKLQTEWTAGSVGYSADYGPTAFTTPSVSTDSALIFGLVRLNTTSGGEYRLIMGKRHVSKGFTATRVTTGGNVIIASENIDNSKFPDSVANANVFISLVVRLRYP